MFFPDAPEVDRRVLIGRLGFVETSTDWRAALDGIDVLYNLGPNHLHADPSVDKDCCNYLPVRPHESMRSTP